MGVPGPMELIVIGVLLLVFVGVPIAVIIALVMYFKSRGDE